MMPGDREPPGKEERAGATPDAGSRHRQLTSHLKTESYPHRRGLAEAEGDRFARGWQAGFVRGALDSLRMLRRRCCLDCAAEVDQLVDYYRGAVDRWAS
jgi:hypothetical protein